MSTACRANGIKVDYQLRMRGDISIGALKYWTPRQKQTLEMDEYAYTRTNYASNLEERKREMAAGWGHGHIRKRFI